MKVNQIIDRIRKDWKVILPCFVIAVVTYVFHQTSLIEKRNFIIPVNFVENGDFVVTDKNNDRVNITIQANSEKSSAIHSSQFYAYVNLDSITEPGDYDLPILISIDNELLSIDPLEISQKPKTIKVHADRIGIKHVAVSPVLVGEPAHGYEVKSYTVDPPFVKIQGPSKVVNSIDHVITEKVLVQDLKRSSSIKVNTDVVNKLIELESTGPYTVSVNIDYVDGELDFVDIPVNVNNLSSDLVVKSTIPNVGLRLAGHILSLESYKNLNNVASVDLSEITEEGSYEVDINYSVPSSFSIIQTSMEKIILLIEKVPVVEPEPDVSGNSNTVNAEETKVAAEVIP